MKVYFFYLTVSLVALCSNWLSQGVKISAIVPSTTTAAGAGDREWTLAQTESQVQVQVQAQAKFIFKLFTKICDHLFPIEQNMHARIGS